jgi:ribosomal protein S18 acetylase RimI-like enzyme
MNPVKDIKSLNEIIQNYFLKKTVTNNYLLPEAYAQYITEKKLYFITSVSNAFFLLEKQGFYQLYFYINNENEILLVDAGKPVVMEILYRGEAKRPNDIMVYWEKCGFRQHLTRDNMAATFNQLTIPSDSAQGVELKYAESREEILFVKELLENALDKYTGDILSYDEVYEYVQKKNVICALWNGEPVGALQFELKNNVFWLGHVAVADEFRGKGVAKELVKAYIADNAKDSGTKYQLWVIQNNMGAVNLYRKFGFMYGNKSSASMLKE